MKQLTIAIWWLAATAAAMMAQNAAPKAAQPGPIVKCRDSGGRPCTAKQVQDLSDAVYAGKRTHDALGAVRNLTLASSDGTLKCEQTDGTPCSTAQLDQVKLIAVDQKLYINYNTARSNTAK